MTNNSSDHSTAGRLSTRRAAAERESAELHLLVSKGRERERERIAQELHDGALQSLVGIKLDVDKVVSEVEVRASRAVAADLAGIANRIQDCIKEIRAILSDLEPPDIESIDITEAMHRFIDAFRDRHLVQVRRHLEPVRTPLSPELKLGIFRILQEALNNVAKHGDAACVGVELKSTGKELELRVSDDGRGFDASQRTKPFQKGLRNMRSRAKALGGSARVQSSPHHGAVVIARIPIEEGAGSTKRSKA
jgi:signal transduction histidine kinase